MVTQARNFLKAVALNTAKTLPKTVVSGLQVFVLRSLPPIVADEIPRRFSSSSLPPSFASGRFADLSFSPLRSPRRAAAFPG
jgi:hypothetical protein